MSTPEQIFAQHIAAPLMRAWRGEAWEEDRVGAMDDEALRASGAMLAPRMTGCCCA